RQPLAKDAREVLESFWILAEKAVERRPVETHQAHPPRDGDRSGPLTTLQQRHFAETLASLKYGHHLLVLAFARDYLEFAIEDDVESIALIAGAANEVPLLVGGFDEQLLYRDQIRASEETEDLNLR